MHEMLYERGIDVKYAAKFSGSLVLCCVVFFFFQAEDGIRDHCVTGVQTCALPIFLNRKILELHISK